MSKRTARTINLPVRYSADSYELLDHNRQRLGTFQPGVGQQIATALNSHAQLLADNEELRTERDALVELLERCRYALTFVPEEALGYGDAEDGHGGSYNWPIRDELAAAVSKQLTALKRDGDGG